MLLVPLPQDDAVRRQPWVTYTLIGLNLLVFVVIGQTYDAHGAERRLRRAVEDAIEYLLPRPYLEVPEELLAFIDTDGLRAASRDAEARGIAPSGRELEREQAELDELAAGIVRIRADSPYARLGLVPARARPHAYVTSLFLHSGWLHLIGNMLFLYLTAPFVEDAFGRILFPGLYLLGGIVASTAHVREHPDSFIPLVGASGAIAAVMGIFLSRFATKRIKLLVLPIPVLPVVRFTALVPAFLVLPAWFGEQLWYAGRVDGGGVAWWAHVGGFVFGVIAAGLVKLTRLEELWIEPGIEAKTSFAQHEGVVQATQLRVRGDYARAWRELRGALAQQPRNIGAWAEAYELALAEESPERAGQAAARLLELYAGAGETQLARDLVYDVSQRAPEPMPARYHAAAAGFLERDGDARSALEHYARVAELDPDSPGGLRALMRRADLLRRAGDRRGAREELQRAREHPACAEPWLGTIERALEELG